MGTPLQAKHLMGIMPGLQKIDAQFYMPHLKKACRMFGINNHPRLSYFLGQLAHESGELNYWQELGSSAYLLSKPYYPYYGRGPIQLTWKENYRKVGNRLKLDLVHRPSLLTHPEFGFKAAAAFWRGTTNGVDLNSYADKPSTASFNKIMRTVLGTSNHPSWQSRADYTNRAFYDVLPKNIYVPTHPVKAGGRGLGSGWYVQQHPTHFNFRPDVRRLVNKYEEEFLGDIFICTYEEHPPQGFPRHRWWDPMSFDIWGSGFRGQTVDAAPNKWFGWLLVNRIMRDPDLPLIRYLIYNGWIWTRWNGWQIYDVVVPGSDWRHDHHIHVTFDPVP